MNSNVNTNTGAYNFEYLKYITETTDTRAILRDLMAAYGDHVWNYAYSLCRNSDQADDITQDVFLKVYRKLGTFRGESSVKTWILTITRNTAYDMKRSSFWNRVKSLDFFQPVSTQPSAEHEAIENMAVNDLWKQVMNLPVKYREVVILYAHYQLSMKEMGRILNLSEGTVKSRLFHARARLVKMKERDSLDASE
ncbi:RNA polymerase sigma factor [Gorillibacterium sp. sgz5001074]|uniref:RNA polymerase sigma factor n=1 Tax=Gorillibacterium sp. sgz5001074 TaxID=3446695 RepID=UPI003F6758DE